MYKKEEKKNNNDDTSIEEKEEQDIQTDSEDDLEIDFIVGKTLFLFPEKNWFR